MSVTRMPTQKRSIKKRNIVIEKGFELICEQGYYNTTIPDIAKYANVSVGIIYQYFNNKKDIFIEGVKQYSNNIMYPVIILLESEKVEIENLESLLKNIIKQFITNHTISKKAHEELLAMSHLDDDIAKIFNDSEYKTTEKIVNLLECNNIHIQNPREKVHIIWGIIDIFCHEVVYHKHSKMNYDIMQNEVISIIMYILKGR